jgi:hypothetical protein
MVRYELMQQQFWKGVVNAGSHNGGSIPPTSTKCGVEQWSARKAHNLEVGGSNPSAATNTKIII